MYLNGELSALSAGVFIIQVYISSHRKCMRDLSVYVRPCARLHFTELLHYHWQLLQCASCPLPNPLCSSSLNNSKFWAAKLFAYFCSCHENMTKKHGSLTFTSHPAVTTQHPRKIVDSLEYLHLPPGKLHTLLLALCCSLGKALKKLVKDALVTNTLDFDHIHPAP